MVRNNPHISTKLSEMPAIQTWRIYVRKKYQLAEEAYYLIIDDLQQKIADLGEVNQTLVPDLNLYTFSFIKEWQNGSQDTKYIFNILKAMPKETVARTQLTRKLTKFMHNKEKSCPKTYEYTKFALEKIIADVMPKYINYLEFLTKFFEKMQKIDNEQIPLTWLKQTFRNNGEVIKSVRDITLNQAFREIKTMVILHNSEKYMVGKNLVIFNEELSDNDEDLHWIFGPESYINQLKELFHVTESIALSEEKEYIKRLIGDYVK